MPTFRTLLPGRAFKRARKMAIGDLRWLRHGARGHVKRAAPINEPRGRYLGARSVDLDGHGLSRCCAIMRREPRASWSRPHWRTEP
ncbi:hypothetical protein VTO73DRAFT_9062 [Trametes versicolor]